MALPKILLIEDEPGIADTVVYALDSEGYDTHWVQTGEAGLQLARSLHPELVILDIGLPDMNGFEVFRRLDREISIPVIFLTAREGEVDRVTGLEMGADDYVVKPFSPRELTARVRAVLRRSRPENPGREDSQPWTVSGSGLVGEVEAFGPFEIDGSRWRVHYHGHALDLTRHEFDLITTLIRAQGQVFSREQLLQSGWDAPDHRLDRTVDAHVKNIRAKLRSIDEQSDPVKTKRGVGYYVDWQP